jgi:hypothetical protein
VSRLAHLDQAILVLVIGDFIGYWPHRLLPIAPGAAKRNPGYARTAAPSRLLAPNNPRPSGRQQQPSPRVSVFPSSTNALPSPQRGNRLRP